MGLLCKKQTEDTDSIREGLVQSLEGKISDQSKTTLPNLN